MVKQHLKRISMPKSWQIKRKGITFIARPKPGSHKLSEGMALSVMMKKILGLETTKEAKTLIYAGDVLVDGIARKEHRGMIGLMDIISFPKVNKHYRIILNANAKIDAIEIPEKEAKIKPTRIEGKSVISKGRIQLNLAGGRNLLLDKNDYKTGDTLMISVPEQKIEEHIPLGKDSSILLVGGKHAGTIGTVNKVVGNNIAFTGDDGKEIETLKRYAFVIGKKKPSIKIQE